MNNIKISSGFGFKKFFGSQSLNIRPTIVHNGTIIGQTIFKNQNIPVLLENNLYYSAHGLPDNFTVYEALYVGFNINTIQSLSFKIQQTNDTISPIEQRLYDSYLRSIIESNSLNINPRLDPYDNNPPPTCSIP